MLDLIVFGMHGIAFPFLVHTTPSLTASKLAAHVVCGILSATDIFGRFLKQTMLSLMSAPAFCPSFLPLHLRSPRLLQPMSLLAVAASETHFSSAPQRRRPVEFGSKRQQQHFSADLHDFCFVLVLGKAKSKLFLFCNGILTCQNEKLLFWFLS